MATLVGLYMTRLASSRDLAGCTESLKRRGFNDIRVAKSSKRMHTNRWSERTTVDVTDMTAYEAIMTDESTTIKFVNENWDGYDADEAERALTQDLIEKYNINHSDQKVDKRCRTTTGLDGNGGGGLRAPGDTPLVNESLTDLDYFVS